MSEAIVEAFLFDGRGGATALSARDFAEAAAPGPGEFVWAHLDFHADQDWLRTKAGVDAAVVRSLLAQETRPRCARHGTGLLVNLRGVNLNPEEEPEDMVSLRMRIEPGRLISVRLRQLQTVAAIRERLRAGGPAPHTPGGLLSEIAAGLTDRMEPVVRRLTDDVDDFEEQALDGPVGELRPKVASLRHDAVMMRRFVPAQAAALATLSKDEAGLFEDAPEAEFRELSERAARMAEELTAACDRAGVIAEQLAARRAEEMNHNTYVLSVVAAIFLPLSFVTGLLGVNVGGIPGASAPYAFAVLCGILLLVSAVLVYLFRRRQWF